QVVELSCGIVPPEYDHRGLLGPYKFSGVVRIRPAPTVGYVQYGAGGRQHKTAVPRDIEGVCDPTKDILSAVDGFPISLVTFHLEISPQEHDCHFILPGMMFPLLPLGHCPCPEGQIV